MSDFNSILRAVSAGLETPVVIILILLICLTVIILGTLVGEFFSERRKLKVSMPELVDSIRRDGHDIRETVSSSGLLKRQKNLILEITKHEALTPAQRESLAANLVTKEQAYYNRKIKTTDLIAKLGPMFGLLGTLIPLGPGIIALGQGDTVTLSKSLLTAFDTTVAGLICAAAALVISVIRKRWYSEYMADTETIIECILEEEAGSNA